MFTNLEVGKHLAKTEFEERELKLRSQLQQAQRRAIEHDVPIIIIVAGPEGAGKGTVVHKLNEWMDPRSIETQAFWDHSDEEESRPWLWRFWRRLPRRGRTCILFSGWYKQPLYLRVLGKISKTDFKEQLQWISDLEHMLVEDGTLIVKLWFHISRETQRLQLAEEAPRKQQNLRSDVGDFITDKLYTKFLKAGEQAVLATDSGHSPWQLIEAEDRFYRDLTAGQRLLDAINARLAQPEPADNHTVAAEYNESLPTILDTIDLTQRLDKEDYKRQLRHYQGRLQDLSWQMRSKGRSVVAVFEGWDAAGKGSAIRRVTSAVDPRLYSLQQVAAPSTEELNQHYLWRFWRNLARDGTHTFFDRSWYGRVLVERVEGFARQNQWQRAYGEINNFEYQLAKHGSTVLKFWIHIDQDEQLRRFEERETLPYKRYKITEEDWRNREKWREYSAAVDEMISRTGTVYAPWTLIAGNNKHHARIHILRAFCEGMEQALGIDKADKDVS